MLTTNMLKGLGHLDLDRGEGIDTDPKPAGRRVSSTESHATFLLSRAELWESQLIFDHKIIVPALSKRNEQ